MVEYQTNLRELALTTHHNAFRSQLNTFLESKSVDTHKTAYEHIHNQIAKYYEDGYAYVDIELTIDLTKNTAEIIQSYINIDQMSEYSSQIINRLNPLISQFTVDNISYHIGEYVKPYNVYYLEANIRIKF